MTIVCRIAEGAFDHHAFHRGRCYRCGVDRSSWLSSVWARVRRAA